MFDFFAELATLEWIYLAFFCVGLFYALFLAVFGLGRAHGLEHAGDVHADVSDLGPALDVDHGIDLGHVDVDHGIEIGHVDVDHGIDLGHVDVDHGIDLGHVDVDHGIDLDHAVDVHLDIDHAVDVDLDGDVSGHRLHLLPLNPLVIATFLGGFGGVGILGTRLLGLHTALSLLVALPAGLVLGGGMYAVYALLLSQAGTSSAISWLEHRGVPARVLTPIREKGLGEIVYEVRGSRYSSPARAIDGRAISKENIVTILDVQDGVAIVDIRYVD